MKNLEFKRCWAKNFICFGPDGVEIDLQNGSRIVHITGENLDQKNEEEECEGSNGAGKSSAPEIIVYALFGRTIKDPKKVNLDDVIHNKIGKGLEVGVEWDEYRVIRRRQKASLEFLKFENGQWKDESAGAGGTETQKKIETALGMSYETFTNIVIFTDNDIGSFLEATGPQKRAIVENLLSLSVYREYFDVAKEEKKNVSSNVDELTGEYERLLTEKDAIFARVKKAESEANDWKTAREEEFKQLKHDIMSKIKALKSSDEGAALAKFNHAQDQIQKLNKQVPELNQIISDVNSFLKKAEPKLMAGLDKKHRQRRQLQTSKVIRDDFITDIEKKQTTINGFKEKDGQECPTCLGVVESKNFQRVVNKEKEAIEMLQKELKSCEKEIKELTAQEADVDAKIIKVQTAINTAQSQSKAVSNKLAAIRQDIGKFSKVTKPDATTDQLLLEQQINDLRKQGVAKKKQIEGPSPFAQIIADAEQELENKATKCIAKKQEIKDSEKLLPYYEYWKTAFGDNGIRKWVIDDIIPALNSRIAYWFQFLLNNRYSLSFNNQFKETIERNPADGTPFVYSLLSRSQRRRMNLSVSQAFAHVMSLSVGTSPNIVFLDEVSSSVDPPGIEGIYAMICELSKYKKVFVTTHSPHLQEKLSGCKELFLRHEDGFTRFV